MAMANYSIYVFSGLMKDMDDDELAIVLGHELTHATYEHSRRQAKEGMASGVAGQAAQMASGLIKNDLGKMAAKGEVLFRLRGSEPKNFSQVGNHV